jgi:hypothetical protein
LFIRGVTTIAIIVKFRTQRHPGNPITMDEDHHIYNSEYATIGNGPAQPWEILPIWLYLVGLPNIKTLHSLSKRNKKD